MNEVFPWRILVICCDRGECTDSRVSQPYSGFFFLDPGDLYHVQSIKDPSKLVYAT
jgi:hypothetical protein